MQPLRHRRMQQWMVLRLCQRASYQLSRPLLGRLRSTRQRFSCSARGSTGEQYHGRQHPDRDAGGDRARPSPLGVSASPDHRGSGRLHGREQRAHSDGPGRSRAHTELDLARPRQRHRGADDLARRPRHAARAHAGGGVLRRIRRAAQTFGRGADPSVTKYGAGGLRPAWEPAPDTRYSPLWHYPWSETRAALERLATEHEGSRSTA